MTDRTLKEVEETCGRIGARRLRFMSQRTLWMAVAELEDGRLIHSQGTNMDEAFDKLVAQINRRMS